MYCVAITLKITEQVKERICIEFCVKLEHSTSETIQMIQKAAAVGNWWLAASSWQRAPHAWHLVQSFLATHQITQVTQTPYSPGMVPCDFWLFPKLKSPLKVKRFQTINEIQENTTEKVTENCERSQGAYFEGDWGIIVLCTMFLVSCVFFNKCLYFS